MNRPPADVERELTERLHAIAPTPRAGALDQALARIASTSQRRGWSVGHIRGRQHGSLARVVAIAVVAAVAVIVGVNIGRLGLLIGETSAPSHPQARSPSLSDGGASPSETIDGSVRQFTEEHGIRLTASLDRDRTSFGQRLWAEVTVKNLGPDSVWWQRLGDCPWPVEITVTPETPTPLDQGRDDWPGELGIVKDALIADEQPTAPDRRRSFVSEERLDSGIMGCFTVLINEELPEDASVGYRAAWDTDDFMGMPPVPGMYIVDVSFEFWRRAVPEFPPLGTDPVAVSVQLPLVVEGPAIDWISPGVAVDALLSDHRFLTLLADAPPLGRGGEMTFAEETWVATYNFATGDADVEPVATLVGVVDARTGRVLEVRFED